MKLHQYAFLTIKILAYANLARVGVGADGAFLELEEHSQESSYRTSSDCHPRQVVGLGQGGLEPSSSQPVAHR